MGIGELGRRDRGPEALADGDCLGVAASRQNQRELLAAEARGDVVLADAFPYQPRDALDHGVAAPLSVGVVDHSHHVEVDHGYRD